MDTEIGHIADLLANTETDKTPLQKQLDGLSKIIASIAGIALVLVVLLGLLRGESFDTLFITGVALAVAAIPTGLPAVVTALLSMGTREIARRNAIVKRLPAVETLGSTSAICSDKTGTLTLNKMTARELAIPGQNRYTVSGEGYSTAGEIKHVGGSHIDLDPYLLPMVAVRRRRARRRGPDRRPDRGRADRARRPRAASTSTRPARDFPRVAEVPFDSEYKFMATFHEMTGRRRQRRSCAATSRAPRTSSSPAAARYRTPDGSARADHRREPAPRPRGERPDGQLRRTGDGGRPARLRPGHVPTRTATCSPLVTDLTLLAMVGIVDPPRPEAKAAIAECHDAGIRVRMITGDHATTAAAIAGELGIEGRAITGTEFAAMSDEELLADSSPRSASSPGSRPRTRSGWSSCSSARATSSR